MSFVILGISLDGTYLDMFKVINYVTDQLNLDTRMVKFVIFSVSLGMTCVFIAYTRESTVTSVL